MAGVSARNSKSNNKKNKSKRYHSRNNAVAWQKHKPAHGQRMKRDMDQIKEKKAHKR